MCVTWGSDSFPYGIPCAIQRRISRYSCESVVNLWPPPWGTVLAAFCSNRLRSGAAGKKSPTSRFFDQILEIFGRFETQQRQFEAVLTARFSVAAATVAAELRKDGDDLVREIDRHLIGVVGNGHRYRRTKALGRRRRNRRISVRQWRYQSRRIDLHDAGGGRPRTSLLRSGRVAAPRRYYRSRPIVLVHPAQAS